MDYYGNEPSSDFFMHYGVKGMKWGVRKAIELGSKKALAKQYRKAYKKLRKLEANADINVQNKKAVKHLVKAIGFGGVALGGVGVGLRNKALSDKAKEVLNSNGIPIGDIANKEHLERVAEYRKRGKKIVNKPMTVEIGEVATVNGLHPSTFIYPDDPADFNVPYHGITASVNEHQYTHSVGPVGTVYSNGGAHRSDTNPIVNKKSGYSTVNDIANGIKIAGLGGMAYQIGRASVAKYRTTKKGHSKAVAKRNAWRNEMANTFKGTRYANLPKYDQVKSKIRHDDLTQSDHLAHYGIKGMKWGVRKAIYNNNNRALESHYRRAARKLAKLEKIGNNSKKYGARAAIYGTAAGLAGGLALTNKTGAAISKLGGLVGTGLQSIPGKHNILSGIRRRGGQLKLDAKNAGDFLDRNRVREIVKETTKSVPVPGKKASDYLAKHPEIYKNPKELEKVINADPTSTVKKVTEKSTSYQAIPSYGRLASGAAAIGLAGLAAKNAYRATHGAKYRAKANEFRNAMNETFKGTKYEGLNGIPLPKKKRKRR